jgi:hypothetical protein
MVVNFRARGISRGARKLARTPTIIKKKKEWLFDSEQHFCGALKNKKSFISNLFI